MMKINYQKRLDAELEQLAKEERVPTLLLHSCCAPCSSYVLEYLANYFHITLFYYNPNIAPAEEYHRRVEEQKRLISQMPFRHPVLMEEGSFDSELFYDAVKGLEQQPEGGERCFRCYELRLRQAASFAKERKFDYFTTTLSVSPHKNAGKLNEIGTRLSEEYGVAYLGSDFKKKEGYKRSIILSEEYGLYRQDYCGCVYSKNH